MKEIDSDGVVGTCWVDELSLIVRSQRLYKHNFLGPSGTVDLNLKSKTPYTLNPKL